LYGADVNCSQCRVQNAADAVFCENCGSRLEVACPNCGGANRLGAKFCNKCGQRLPESETAASVAGQKFGSVQAYTPKHLAEKILTSKHSLEGERKQITVLFADMRGSMELLADRDPEEARKILDPVLEHMMEAVHRYEGTVSNLLGDGVMALFGAPLAHEDHAVRACYAALRMQESVKQYAEKVRMIEGVPIQIRVGLNSGEVVVGSIGNDLKMDYTAVGQTTHLAARMEQAAIPGTVLISADTLRLVEGYVDAKSLGPLVIKGLGEPVEVYEVVGAASVRSRFRAAATRGLTRFVGRDAEVEQLCKALEQAKSGQGQIVAVVGEPGVGKSRLFYEFTRSQQTRGEWLIVESSSASYGKATPYLPVIDLIKTYCQIEARDDNRKIREKLTGKLLALDRALETTLPAFFSLVDVPVDDSKWQSLDPPQRRQRTLDALKRMLLKESQVQPVLLVFEDLHWVDSETQALLDVLVESVPTARIFLLVNYRPEYQHNWGSKTYYRQLRIDPLPTESAEELLISLLGDDAALLPLRRLLIERTEGNPFFLEESVRTLIETKVLAGERGSYRLTKAVENIRVPATVQAVLAARIDRLLPEEKQLLQSASVIGEYLPFTLLQAVTDVTEDELRRCLAHLQAAEFLYEASVFPELEYTFKHGLTHQVAYNSLLQERRRALHGRIMEATEKLYASRTAEQIERLAYHAFRGEVWNKAVVYLRQAGQKAATRSANQEAVGYFEQALEAIGHLPEGREKMGLSIDVRLDLRPSMLPLGAQERMIEHLTQAESLAVKLGDKWRLGRVYADLNAHYAQFGENLLAITPGERALTIATELKDFALQVIVHDRLARAYHGLGDHRRAIDLCNRSLLLLEHKPIGERFGLTGIASVVTRVGLVSSLSELGNFVEGIGRGEEAIRIAEIVGQPFSLVASSSLLADLYITKGDIKKALPLLERSLLILQEGKVPIFSSQVKASLGFAYLHSGRTIEALQLLEEAAERPTMGRFHTLHLSWLGIAYLLAERKEEAIKVALRALSRARDKKEKGYEAWVLRSLGEISAHKDPPNAGEIEIYYRQSSELAVTLGMRPLLAHCRVSLGRFYRCTGERQKAENHLATGISMMREMEMGVWLEKAEAELKQVG
jgi:class 3 adenylate cyclase/tetratricopeptide (TPR) repeat protein